MPISNRKMSNIIDALDRLPTLSREERATVMDAREKKMDLVFGDRALAEACAKLNEIDREMPKILKGVEIGDVLDWLSDREYEINREIEDLEDEKEVNEKIENTIRAYKNAQ